MFDPLQLKKWRERNHLTQMDAGRVLNVAKNTIARWERGELTPEHPTLIMDMLDRYERNTGMDAGRVHLCTVSVSGAGSTKQRPVPGSVPPGYVWFNEDTSQYLLKLHFNGHDLWVVIPLKSVYIPAK